MTEDTVVTKDRWAILVLLAKHFVPMNICVMTSNETQRSLQYEFGAEAYELYDAYMRGEPIPIDDVRDIEQADRVFKNNLHRYLFSEN